MLAVMVCVLPVWGQDVPVQTLAGHTDWVSSLAFSPDGKILASGSGDSMIKLWDVTTGREVRSMAGHASFVLSVAFSPDGEHLASGSHDRTARVWDARTGREVRAFEEGMGYVSAVAFLDEGSKLVAVSGWAVFYDATTGRFGFHGTAYHPVRVYEVASGRELRAITVDSVYYAAFSRGTRVLASVFRGGVQLWDVRAGTLMNAIPDDGNTSTVTLSPDGTVLARPSQDETGVARHIKLWDVATGRELRTLTGHTGTVSSVVFSPDGALLASGSFDRTIKLWDVEKGQELCTLTGHTHRVVSLAFSPDGRTLASGSDDQTIKLWDLAAVLDPNEPPTARFTFDPAPARVNEWVTFDASDSHDPDGEIVRYAWNWNSDGTFESTTTLPITGHRFTAAGTHRVTLQVTDNDGARREITQTVVVEAGSPPVASFTVALHIEHLGLVLRRREVTFDASASHDPDGEIVWYQWDFGDGNTAEGRIVTHTYPEAGTYTVRLTVTDDDGMTDTTEQEVQVVPGGGGGPG